MARDTLTIKLKIEADSDTIQAIRLALASDTARHTLGQAAASQLKVALRPHQIGLFQLSPQVLVSRYRETKKGAYPPPILQDGLLTIWDYDLNRTIETIPLDSVHWFDWLQETNASSFRYLAAPASFTPIKEFRRARPVWYAHKRSAGKLKRFYLGKSVNLTAHKLADTARKFSQLLTPVSLNSETGPEQQQRSSSND